MYRILAIFTCFNRREKTRKCLERLIQGNPNIHFKFIAVDDNSTDGTWEMLSKYKEVQVLRGNGNLYYSGGMRLGIAAAKEICDDFDRVMLLNDDVEFYPNAIEKLIQYSDEKNEIVAGATCDKKGMLSYGGAIKKSKFRPAYKIVMSEKKKIYCDTFNANCVLIPVNVFKVLPNIDEVYTHYAGDYDYGLEAGRLGYVMTVSDFFVGECEDNPLTGTWRDIKLSRRERIRRKESPKGLPYREWYHFVRKNYGVPVACISSIIPYIKIMIRRP